MSGVWRWRQQAPGAGTGRLVPHPSAFRGHRFWRVLFQWAVRS